MALDQLRQALPILRYCRSVVLCRICQGLIDDGRRDGVLDVERRDAPHEVLKFAHVAGPDVLLKARDRSLLDRLLAEALTRGDTQEMPGQIGDILGSLSQWRQPQGHDVQSIVEVLPE